MRKHFSHISAFLFTIVVIFAVSGLLFPQTAHADILEVLLNPLTWPVKALGVIVYAILQFVSLLTGLSGVVLNGVIYYTVGQMSANYTGLTAINSAWSTIRDLANMGFIFILLYAAIQTILGIGSDTQKLIRNIIIVAILINFSLFFTKIVIDVSNILAILFYDAIAPGALSVASLGTALTQSGLSNAFMNAMNLQSLFNVGGLGEIPQIITLGLMGSIMLLIATFVFFAAAIMFVIRYVILILVIILSPLAFMGFIMPQLGKYKDQWWDALSGQAFFAPIYFMLIWISLQVVTGIGSSLRGGGPIDATTALSGLSVQSITTGGLQQGAFAMFINFIVVIVFLIAALLIAKEWANKAGPRVTGLTKWAMGAAGGATLGAAGWAGRRTLGRAGAAIEGSEALRERAAKGGAGGMTARLALATGRKTSGASFDIRGTKLGGSLDAGKAGGKGGFAEFRKKQAEAAEKTAKALGPSDVTLDQAEQAVKRARTDEERRIAQVRLDQLKGVNQKEVNKRRKEAEERSGREIERDPIIKKREEMEKDIKRREKDLAETILPGLKLEKERELEVMRKEFETAKAAAQARRSEMEAASKAEIDSIREIKSTGDRRKEAYANVVEKSLWGKMRGYNQAAAAQIRRGKSKEKKLAEAYKDITKDEEPETGAPETPTETPPATPPAEGTPPTT